MHVVPHRGRTLALVYSSTDAPAVRRGSRPYRRELAALTRLLALATPAVCVTVAVPAPHNADPTPAPLGAWHVTVCPALPASEACSALPAFPPSAWGCR